MRSTKFSFFVMLLVLALMAGCSGGSGGSNGSSAGTVSLSMTDAKPVLPDHVTNCFVTIDEVLVHSSGGTWKSLPMVQTPYIIDLLEFSDGTSTEFVPPVALDPGKYTQIRLSIIKAVLRLNDGTTTKDITMTIPSGNLKTDKNFDFDATDSAAVDITIDFDLSKSIVVQGPSGDPSYQMKPVLHIVNTKEAATIEGTIDNTAFDATQNAQITVLSKDANGNYTEEYTKIEVTRHAPPGTTNYEIFWLVPNQDYKVQIDYDPTAADGPEDAQVVFADKLGPGMTASGIDFPTATIEGTIDNTAFDATQNAQITVLSKDANGNYTEEYTKIEVTRNAPPGTTNYEIFGLAPNQDYKVQIDYDPTATDGPEDAQVVIADKLGPGKTATGIDFPTTP